MPKLFLLLLGCTPAGRHTEQHDVYFGIGAGIKDLLPGIRAFWPEGSTSLHVDAWREVSKVEGYRVSVIERNKLPGNMRLYFINLGGYRRGEFDEAHYKLLVVAARKGEAVRRAKQTAFFKHTGFSGASAHVDDKWGVDVDDVHEIADILPTEARQHYSLLIEPATTELPDDELHLGYFRLNAVDKWAGPSASSPAAAP